MANILLQFHDYFTFYLLAFSKSLLFIIIKMVELGDLVNFHMDSMFWSWILVVDIVILAGTFKNSKAAIIIHSIGGFLLILLTTIPNYPILVAKIQYIGVISGAFLFHVVFGTFCFFATILLLAGGLLTRISNIAKASSLFIINIKRFHMIVGIIMTILFKYQTYYILNSDNKISRIRLGIAIDIIFIVLYTYRSLFLKKLHHEDHTPAENEATLPKITSLSEIQDKQVIPGVYINKVYDLRELQLWHPGGFQIVQSAAHGELQKYLLGIYSPAEGSIPSYTHSSQSISLMGNPIAKLNIQPQYPTLLAENKIKINSIFQWSTESAHHEVFLHHEEIKLNPEEYTDIKQLGRYFCLSIQKDLTRTYTCANFLSEKNITFLQKHLKQSAQLSHYLKIRTHHNDCLPLLIKKYPNGKFTSKLFSSDSHSLVLSEQLGLGFQLDDIKSGDVVIVAAGTGFFVFLDLIDIIYKRHLALEKPELASEIHRLYPVTTASVWGRLKFKIFAAFQSIDDIHPITLAQILELSKSEIVSFELKIKKPFSNYNNHQLKLTNHRFEKVVSDLLLQKDISKIYVCGPDKLSQSVYSQVKKSRKDYTSLMIV